MELVNGLILLLQTNRSQGLVTVYVDNDSGMKSMSVDKDSQLKDLDIKVELSDKLNKNYIASVDRAIQELEAEMRQICPEAERVSPATLSLAVKRVNSKIRNQGLSASELHWSREQLTGENLQLDDQAIANTREDIKTYNHPFSSKCKHPKGAIPTIDNYEKGDLVYLKTDPAANKHAIRQLYMVTKNDDENGKLLIQKILHSHSNKETKLKSERLCVEPSQLFKSAAQDITKSHEEKNLTEETINFKNPPITKSTANKGEWNPIKPLSLDESDESDDDDSDAIDVINVPQNHDIYQENEQHDGEDQQGLEDQDDENQENNHEANDHIEIQNENDQVELGQQENFEHGQGDEEYREIELELQRERDEYGEYLKDIQKDDSDEHSYEDNGDEQSSEDISDEHSSEEVTSNEDENLVFPRNHVEEMKVWEQNIRREARLQLRQAEHVDFERLSPPRAPALHEDTNRRPAYLKATDKITEQVIQLENDSDEEPFIEDIPQVEGSEITPPMSAENSAQSEIADIDEASQIQKRTSLLSTTDHNFLEDDNIHASTNSLFWDSHESTSKLAGDLHNKTFNPLSYLQLEISPNASDFHRVYTYENALPLQPSMEDTNHKSTFNRGERNKKSNILRRPLKQSAYKLPDWFTKKLHRRQRRKDGEDRDNPEGKSGNSHA